MEHWLFVGCNVALVSAMTIMVVVIIIDIVSDWWKGR